MMSKYPSPPGEYGNLAVSGNGNEVFLELIRTLLGQVPFRIYAGYTVKTSEERKFSVTGVAQEDHLSAFKDKLLDFELQVTDINTRHYCGLYFESLPEWYGLILAPRKETVSLDPRQFNQTDVDRPVFELKKFGEEHPVENLTRLDYEACLSLWSGMERVWADTLGIAHSKLARIKYENSHQEYIRHFLDYKGCRNVFRYDPGECNNIIALFGWIYHWEIKILANLLDNQPVTIHDVGTSLAQFPLLLSALSGEDLFGLNISQILASDKGWTGEIFVKRILAQNPRYRPVQFDKFDLCHDLERLPVTDVIVANDVLEHLPDEATAFSVLKGLWNKTRKVLMVHVPFEIEPNPAWDHHVAFDETKIREWAGELPGACFHSDRFFDGPATLTANGYLIVTK